MSLVGVPAMDSKALGLKKPPSQDTYPQPSGVKAEPFISTTEGHSRMALQLNRLKAIGMTPKEPFPQTCLAAICWTST